MNAPGPLRIVVEQTAPSRLELDANRDEARRAVERAAAGDADLVVFPELALTGYDLGRWTRELATPEGVPPLSGLPEAGPAVVIGHPEAAPDARIFNVATAWRGRTRLHRDRKRYLPTYGMFDEARLFAAGRGSPATFEPAPGWSTALLVCEDLWHPSLVWLAALEGASLLVVVSAAPLRGGLDAEDPDSRESWELLARAAAMNHGLWVVLANRAGVEGPVTFAGGSLVVAPDGRVVARGAVGAPDRIEAVLDPEAVSRARKDFSHLRDEDPRLVRDALDRLSRREGR